MFLDFYQLREHPFGATPDPRFLYLSATHREALASVWYALEAGQGFAVLVAAPGMGKTTLVRGLMKRMEGKARTAYIFESQVSGEELLRAIVKDFGAEPSAGRAALYEQLHEMVAREARVGRRCVVVVDEAQNLCDEALEALRLLTNFETERKKLVQVVLVGQPGLAERLERPELEQLRQRVVTVARIAALNVAETRRYIEHRLHVAGGQNARPFTGDAIRWIAKQSRGIPRNVNTLCFNAMSLGCALGKRKIGAAEVAEVAGDLDLSSITHPTTNAGRSVGEGHLTGGPEYSGKWRPGQILAGAVRAAALAGALVLAGAVSFAGMKKEVEEVKEIKEIEERKATEGAAVKVVRVEEGETLRTISQRYLGRKEWPLIAEIVKLNPEVGDPNRIEVGQKIRLPLPRVQDEKKGETP